MRPFKKIDEYIGQREKYQYPDDAVDSTLKQDKDYYLAFNEAMLADFTNNACEIPYTFAQSSRSFSELHAYATGTQDMNKIKGLVLGEHKKKDGRYLTKRNISWASLPILPKMFDKIREKNMRQEYDVDTYCIDDDSIQAKAADKAMLEYLVSEDAKELFEKTKFKPNTPLDPQQLGLQTQQDVDLYFQIGTYTFEREIACLAACNKTKLVSNYKVIQDGMFDDLFKFGICGVVSKIDTVKNVVKIEKVDFYSAELDMAMVILPFSESNNFDNLCRYGVFKLKTIGQISKENPNITKAELLYIAKSYTYLNPWYNGVMSKVGWYNTSARASLLGNYNSDPMYRCKVLVLDSQWLSVDDENYLKTDGRNLFKSVPYEYKISDERKRKGDTLIKKQFVKKRVSSWVVGTDILLHYGLAENVPYYGPDGDKVPKVDGCFAKTGNISFCERCIPLQDDIDVANVQLRTALSNAIPAPRMIIQTGLLDNVYLNNIKVEPEDGMTTMKELGYLFVNAVDDFGRPIFTNQKLVDFLQSGIGEDIQIFDGRINQGIQAMSVVLGDAETPVQQNPYNGARKTELSMQSSNAALYATFNSFQYCHEEVFEDVVRKWQVIAKKTPISLSYSPLGQRNMQVLKLGKEFTNADFNIKVSMGLTDAELKSIMDDIVALKNQGIQTNFQLGITTSEYLILREKVFSGNPKEAMYVMAKIEAKKIQQQAQKDAQNQQQNAQDQQNSAAAAEKNKQDTAKIQGAEARKTAVVNDASKRKTAATMEWMKGAADPSKQSPDQHYQNVIHEANQEIMPIILQDMKIGLDSQTGNPDQANVA